ncbi:MAG: TonB-dependent receptor plug domain-containing protein [Myxococcales bacterium]|nr:TonB-dependent receptor plug domain-containing protein [Myxococcales bacterium]
MQELRAVPRGGAADLLALAPGFFLSQHGGEGKAHQLFLRGFDAEHGQDVEFTVAGAPVNDVSNGHGQGYADLNFLIPEVVDRLNVIEGPYDPQQGDFAVAASARLDLGVRERGLLVRGQYGSFDAMRAVAVWAPRGASNETFVAAELGRSNGFGPSRASQRAAAIAQYQRSFSTPNGSVSVRATLQSYAGSWQSAGLVREPDFLAGTQGFFDTLDPRQGGFSARHGGVTEVRFRHGALEGSLRAWVTRREFRVRENYTGFLLDARGDRYEQRYEATSFGLDADVRQPLLSWLTARGGAYARHDVTTQSMNRMRFMDDLLYRRDIDADVNATDIALWGELEARPLPWLEIHAGVRADGLAYQIDDRLPRSGSMEPRGRRDAQGIHVGPKASVRARMGRGWSAELAYGKGFRSPQATTLGQGENAPFATVHSGEGALRYTGLRGSATVSGFVTHVDRDLVFDPVLGQNLPVVGAEATTRFGASAQARLAPIRGLALLASGTYARATFDRTGLSVPYVPSLVLRVDGAFEREIARVRNVPVRIAVGVGSSLVGYRALPFSERSDAVFLLDAGASVRVGFVEVGVKVRNVFDARWRDAQFNYPSDWDAGPAGSRVPVRHFTAGRPLSADATLAVIL